MGSPDPFRVCHREHLSEAVQHVVRNGLPLEQAVADLGLPMEDVGQFSETLKAELKMLTVHNCARYRLTVGEVQPWIERGKPI